MPPIRVRYQTIEVADFDIHIRCLRDNQQFADNLGKAEALGISSAQWPLFGIVWESSEILANEMSDFSVGGKRILEIGCGMALSSHVLNARDADITATDMHPEAGAFLVENVRLNNGREIPFLRTDWNEMDDGLGEFDLVIGSDVLYERGHAELLSEFINRHARQHCEVVLVDPGRSHHARFSKNMIALGYTHTQRKPSYSQYINEPFKGQILTYLRN